MKVLCTSAFLSVVLLLTPDSSIGETNVSGNWIFSMAGPNGETVELPMELKVNDKVLEGRVDRGDNQWLKLKNGKADGTKISFTIERDRPGGGTMIYAITGKLEDDKLSGEARTDFQGQEVTGKWSAKRQQPDASRIAGSWTLHLQDPNGGEIDLPMELKVEKQVLTGRVGRGDNRWMTIENGKLEGETFRFTTKRDRPNGGEMIYRMTGKLEANKLKGTATTTLDGAGEVTGDWHATRSGN